MTRGRRGSQDSLHAREHAPGLELRRERGRSRFGTITRIARVLETSATAVPCALKTASMLLANEWPAVCSPLNETTKAAR
jgi:hypothetical protein